MKLRRAAVALSTLAVIATGPGPVGPVAATAGVRPQVTTLLELQTRPIKVHGYHLSISAEQVAVDGTIQFTFLTIALERREPTPGAGETLEQIHQWGWQLPKTAFHLHRDLSQGWIDTGDRMGVVRTPPHALQRHGRASVHRRLWQPSLETGHAPRQHRHRVPPARRLDVLRHAQGTNASRATVIGVTQCGGGGGGGGRFCPSSGLGAMVSDESGFRSMPAPTRLTPPCPRRRHLRATRRDAPSDAGQRDRASVRVGHPHTAVQPVRVGDRRRPRSTRHGVAHAAADRRRRGRRPPRPISRSSRPPTPPPG